VTGPVRDGRTGPERIAVVRALPGVGDLLCAVPALRAVRRAHPAAAVTLVGLPTAAWFLDRYPGLIDDLLAVEGVPGLPEVRPDAAAARRFYAHAGARHFDLALQLHGSGVTTNPLTTMLGARRQVAPRLPGHWRPPGRSLPYPTTGPEIRRLLAVAWAAGCPEVGEQTALPLTDDERADAAALTGGPGAGPYICLHPGASRPGNRWPPARFAAVGDRLAEAGARVVLTGTAAERPLALAVAGALGGPPLDLTGRTSVGTLGALFAAARLVVSNDTGAAHIAAAVGAPSVVVFPADGDPDRWAPLDRRRHRPAVAAPGAGRWPGVDTVLAAAVEAAEAAA
jgi:ADP-heptose:LPS heptosyltransferase